MAFESSTVSVGDSFKKSYFDQLIANDNWNKGRLDTIYSGTNTFIGEKTFRSATTFSGTVSIEGASRIRITKNDAQTMPTETSTIVEYDDEVFDNLGEYDNVTNFRFTAQDDGYYLVIASLETELVVMPALSELYLRLFKNGDYISDGYHERSDGESANKQWQVLFNDLIQLSAGDYIDMRLVHNQGGNVDSGTDVAQNFFIVHRLS